MNANEIRIGTKLDLELINNIGEKIGQSYVSQLEKVIDLNNVSIAAPIREVRLTLIPDGSKIRITFMHLRHGLLSFTGTITGKEKLENMLVFNVKITSPLERIQRRKYYRLENVLNVSYRKIESLDDTPQTPEEDQEKIVYKKALTKDISGSGICLLLDEEIQKNEFLEILVWITNSTYFKARCKVMRATSFNIRNTIKYEAGMFYNVISKKDQELVVKYIFDQQRVQLKYNITKK